MKTQISEDQVKKLEELSIGNPDAAFAVLLSLGCEDEEAIEQILNYGTLKVRKSREIHTFELLKVAVRIMCNLQASPYVPQTEFTYLVGFCGKYYSIPDTRKAILNKIKQPPETSQTYTLPHLDH